MLLSSILRILNKYQTRPKTVQKVMADIPEIDAAAEEAPSLQKAEVEDEASAGLPSPLNGTSDPAGILLVRPSLEELIRVVTKFEKPEQSRVVDVFE